MTVCSNMRCGNTDCENHYIHIVDPGRYEFVDMKTTCTKDKSKKKAGDTKTIEVVK